MKLCSKIHRTKIHIKAANECKAQMHPWNKNKWKLLKCMCDDDLEHKKHRKSYGNLWHRKRQKRESCLHYDAMSAVADIDLYEECWSKIYFERFDEGIAINAVHVLNQRMRQLLRLVRFNSFDVLNENIAEPFNA